MLTIRPIDDKPARLTTLNSPRCRSRNAVRATYRVKRPLVKT
jgi:hypothetical protein